jgi:hypothetical protein
MTEAAGDATRVEVVGHFLWGGEGTLAMTLTLPDTPRKGLTSTTNAAIKDKGTVRYLR